MNLKSGSCYLPKHKPSKPQGEDAHFICDENNTIGVADGVGGWAKQGIDSGIYAREIMSNSVTVIQDRFSGCEVVVNPEEVLSEAYSKTKAEGASTACIITLKDNVVHAVNVGDSRFMIIRRGKTVYKSPVQQKRFNCPYQLGNSSDKPSSAKVINVGVEIGDVIVAGTDGLFDNVFTGGIELLLASLLGDDIGVDEPQEVASKIAELAFSNSNKSHFESPFQLASMNSGSSKDHHQGGKMDDITVIVSFVTPSSPPSLVDDQIQIQMPSSPSLVSFVTPSSPPSLVDDQIQMQMPSSPSLVSFITPSSPPSLVDDQIQMQMPSSPSLVDDQTEMKMPSSPSLVSFVMPYSPPSLVDDQIQIKVPIKRKFWGSTVSIWTTIRNQWKKPRRLALCCCTKIQNRVHV